MLKLTRPHLVLAAQVLAAVLVTALAIGILVNTFTGREDARPPAPTPSSPLSTTLPPGSPLPPPTPFIPPSAIPSVDVAPRPVVTLVTANINRKLSPRAFERQLRWVLSFKPDVVVLQEVGRRDLAGAVRRTPGEWGVWQGTGRNGPRAVALVWNSDRFTAESKGLWEVVVRPPTSDRWSAWAVLRDGDFRFPVIGVHLPEGTQTRALRRDDYRIGTDSLARLIDQFQDAGNPPVLGGDWNRSLANDATSWAPLQRFREQGMKSNWRLPGPPCPGSGPGGAKIDGFLYQPVEWQILQQGCGEYGLSDHRWVWAQFQPK